MRKNSIGTIELFAFDTATGVPKTGDAANITACVKKDSGPLTALTSPGATEVDAVKAPGWYSFNYTAQESNSDALLFAGVSTTGNVSVIGIRIDMMTDPAGIGAITWPYTLTSSTTGLPIADAEVWVTTDAPGANVVTSGRTNTVGMVTFYLDAGSVYVWARKSGFSFVNPDLEVVS